MSTTFENNCTLVLHFESNNAPRVEELKAQLENPDENVKIEALKAIILYMTNGEQLNKLLMPIIKYCLHSENHTIKKLLMLYWEIVNRTKPDGALLPEMILVCNALKNNLSHANEYIRGSTLRLLLNLREQEILESLIPSITANLEHRHSYVRKNAVLAVLRIFESFPDLIPDAKEMVEKCIYAETNPAAKRNEFLMLYQCDEERAVNFLNTMIEQISASDESFQLVALELMRKVCRNPLIKSQYIRSIYGLTNSSSNAVSFEAANTLVSLSSAPTALRAAISAYCRLLATEGDVNVKLIILNRLAPLKRRHEKILQEMLMDILRTLSSPNIDIRRRTLELALDLIAPRNVEEVISLFKKEMLKTESPEQGKSDEYRKLLLDALHKCAVRFPEVAANVVQLLLNYLGDENVASALEVIYFVREIVEQYPQLRDSTMTLLLQNFEEITSAEVYRVALWIIGDYAIETRVLDEALQLMFRVAGDLPFTVVKDDEKQPFEMSTANANAEQKTAPVSSKPIVLADGTYAQQSASSEKQEMKSSALKPTVISVRSLILDGDYFLACALCNSITKLLLRASSAGHTTEHNAFVARGLLLFTSILRVGGVETKHPIDRDSHARVMICIRTLLHPKPTTDIFLRLSRDYFSRLLKIQHSTSNKEEKTNNTVFRQADDLISIRQLKTQVTAEDFEEDEQSDVSRALATLSKKTEQTHRVFQLTGFSDPVYVEAELTVLGYDIVLDLLVVNQTKGVLQNLAVELATSRDLKIVERPQTYNIAAYDFVKIHTNIKVSSTEAGVIFGNVAYDSNSGTHKTVVVLNSIHMDIVDYITPSLTSQQEFRNMWAEFEWENKVAVNTDITEVKDYLNHVIKITNMRCLTPESTLTGDCAFLAANLYARSIFGEDALLNLSVEKLATGKITGYIRIRSKAQGIALSLGDKITNKQRFHQ